MKKFRFKAVLSSLMLLAFLFLAFSGALMYFNKTGMILGIPRGSMRIAHTVVAAFMFVLAAIHLFVNRSLYLSELKSLVHGRISNEKHKEDE